MLQPEGDPILAEGIRLQRRVREEAGFESQHLPLWGTVFLLVLLKLVWVAFQRLWSEAFWSTCLGVCGICLVQVRQELSSPAYPVITLYSHSGCPAPDLGCRFLDDRDTCFFFFLASWIHVLINFWGKPCGVSVCLPLTAVATSGRRFTFWVAVVLCQVFYIYVS